MKYNVIIKTHHKTGTNWMGAIFKRLAGNLDVDYVHLSQIADLRERRDALNSVSDDRKTIFFHPYGQMPVIDQKARLSYRGMHLIRDPRDLIVSSARYHVWSEEAWLHKPDEKFGGKTYQEAINALPDFADQIEFEMHNSAADNINQMVDFDRQTVFFDIKFEDLRKDLDLLFWHRVLLRLGFEGPDLAPAMRLFVENSIQFGKLDDKPHIQDTSLSPWLRKFPREKLPMFDELFADHAQTLGYEATDALIAESEAPAVEKVAS